MALDMQPRWDVHQLWQIKGDDSGVVRNESYVVSGLQFHQWHGPPIVIIDNANATRIQREHRFRSSEQKVANRYSNQKTPLVPVKVQHE